MTATKRVLLSTAVSIPLVLAVCVAQQSGISNAGAGDINTSQPVSRSGNVENQSGTVNVSASAERAELLKLIRQVDANVTATGQNVIGKVEKHGTSALGVALIVLISGAVARVDDIISLLRFGTLRQGRRK